MKISIASDHAGYEYKTEIVKHLTTLGHEVIDFGTDSDVSVDYPDFIKPAAKSVANGQSEIGIVLGGSGNGEAMAANKIKGIRCAVCWNAESARLAKKHNNANMISIGQRMVSREVALQIVDEWIHAEFEGGRHTRRIEKIEAN
jgi:ribose 5-phosphate isomerase B